MVDKSSNGDPRAALRKLIAAHLSQASERLQAGKNNPGGPDTRERAARIVLDAAKLLLEHPEPRSPGAV